VLIHFTALLTQEGTTAPAGTKGVHKDQGQIGGLVASHDGVVRQDFTGREFQGLLQAQEVIRAQKDGGGAATLVETGQAGMTMELKSTLQRERFRFSLLIE